MRARMLPAALLAALACALPLPAAASANAGSAIVNQCTQTGAVSDTYSQTAYNEALGDLGADLVEYSSCEQVIRQAQLAAAARDAGGGTAATALAGTPSVAEASFTPKERAALAALASPKTGGAPVSVGGALVRPGLVPVDLASAASALPAPLRALLVILAAAALLALGRLLRNRVGSHRSH